MAAGLIISPVSMEELLKLSPKKYPEIFDKYGNLDLEEFFHTPEYQELHSIYPIRFNNLKISTKREVITHIFWDLCYLNCFYNKDCYIYVFSLKWFEHNFGHWGFCNFMNFSAIPRVKNLKRWVPWGEEERFNELLETFEKQIDLRKNTYYELKIEGVKE